MGGGLPVHLAKHEHVGTCTNDGRLNSTHVLLQDGEAALRTPRGMTEKASLKLTPESPAATTAYNDGWGTKPEHGLVRDEEASLRL